MVSQILEPNFIASRRSFIALNWIIIASVFFHPRVIIYSFEIFSDLKIFFLVKISKVGKIYFII